MNDWRSELKSERIMRPFGATAARTLSQPASAAALTTFVSAAVFFGALFHPSPVLAQQASSSSESNPVRLKIMQGHPPPPDKLVTQANAMQQPYLRWSIQNVRQLHPTAGIRRGAMPAALPVQEQDLDKVTFSAAGKTMTLAEYLTDSYTDGFLVMYRGKVVYEKYDGAGTQQTPHMWASMTKSLTGLLAAILVHEGKLDPEAKLSKYVPELAGNPFGEATLRQNLDMEASAAYPPNVPPDIGLFAAVGLIPRRAGMPDNIYDFVKSAQIVPDRPSGSSWFYQNGSAEAVAWALERVTGQSWHELASERVWTKIGAEEDAYVTVDPHSTAMASGGMASTLRDLARFAELMRNGGAVQGRQVVPREAVADMLKPAANKDMFAKGNLAAGREGFGYRSYWYQVNDGKGAFEASGRFGQWIHVDPASELTVVKFSSYPDMRPRELSGAQAATREGSGIGGPIALRQAVAAIGAALETRSK